MQRVRRTSRSPARPLPLSCVPRSGHCLCDIDTCIGSLGYYECNAPEVPGTQHPPPPAGTRVVVQTGLTLQRVNGSTFYYNSTTDAAISTLYITEAWNKLQGNTWFYPENPTLDVSDSLGSDHISYRALLRFERLAEMLPAGATLNRANLNLTFINWGPDAVTLQARLGGVRAAGLHRLTAIALACPVCTRTHPRRLQTPKLCFDPSLGSQVCPLNKAWVGVKTTTGKALSWAVTGVLDGGGK